MKAKLIKYNKGDYFLIDPTKGTDANDEGFLLGSSRETNFQKLSKQNCDELFGVMDVEKLAEEYGSKFAHSYYPEDFIAGFNKAMELNKDKVFTVEQIIEAFEAGRKRGMDWELGENNTHPICSEFIQSLQQPSEIEVEIEKEWKPKSNYCVACGEGGKYMEKPCDHKDDCEHWQPKYKNGFLMVKKLKS
jgi:hypothetical protein